MQCIARMRRRTAAAISTRWSLNFLHLNSAIRTSRLEVDRGAIKIISSRQIDPEKMDARPRPRFSRAAGAKPRPTGLLLDLILNNPVDNSKK